MSSVRLEKLSKRYSDADVVQGVDLAIDEGELVVLLGPSGCGKTTTLRMIAGFVQPSAGHVRIAGEVVDHLPPRSRNIGMVFQDYALFPNMPVWENIAFGLQERKAARDAIAGRVDKMLRLIRMEAFGERYPIQLSGGQQQRVALARALAYEPRVLLMDEPLGALDQKLREDMQREFGRIQKSLGITTIFVTHDQQEAMALADRIVVMNAGRIEQAGRPEELYGDPRTLFIATFIGRSNRLAGAVERHDRSGMARVRLSSGETILARLATPEIAAGSAVACVVRPERLRLTHANDQADAANLVSVRARQRSFFGSTVDFVVETSAGEEVVVQATPTEATTLSDGGATALRFAPADCICFPAEAG
jgi:putative spermidine/putrescine transport system ATP-binding protein